MTITEALGTSMPTSTSWWQQSEAELTRVTLLVAAVELLAVIFGFVILYFVLKAAIRDGINESRLGDEWRRTVMNARQAEQAEKLPPIRATD